VGWHGVGAQPDISSDSHTLAYYLRGASENDNDLYVMINAYWQPLDFVVQEGRPQEWKRVVDTFLDSPADFMDPATAPILGSLSYTAQPRSVVVFIRT